jgi:hypothetical protein
MPEAGTPVKMGGLVVAEFWTRPWAIVRACSRLAYKKKLAL